MKKQTIANVAVLLAVAVLCVIAGGDFLKMQQEEPFYTANPNLTKTLRLSDYNPNLKGTGGDVDIYVFDSGVPGGKALVYGGTHTNEISATLSANTFLENAKCEQGILYVIVHANNSGFSHTEPLRAQMEYMTFALPDGSTREFRVGTRLTNPVHQWPDPNYRFNRSGRELKHDEVAEIRNMNRNHPGVEDGYLTEAACYGLYNFIKTENIDLVYDGHEASPEFARVNYVIAHERAMTMASSAVMNCNILGLPHKVDISGKSSYGLSHRSLGDNTEALCTLFETLNPVMGPCHDKVTEALVKEGISPNYVKISDKGGILTSCAMTDAGSPIEERVAYHFAMATELLTALGEYYPGKEVIVTGLPTPEEIMTQGLEQILKPLAA